MLEITNLVKEYQSVTAVNDISFKVEPGKIFGVLGPNGAGKTTTIRIILDIIKPTSGTVTFKGNLIDDDFKNIVGYLPEERGLYKKSKCADVIAYFAELKNVPKGEISKKTDYWFKRLEIEHYKDSKIEELSKGNQQKVQFITAVINNPDLLILDEPFSGFDPVNQQLIRNVITEFLGSGKTIIISTHMMDVAESLCNGLILINKGKEILHGSLDEVKNQFGTNTYRIKYSGDAGFVESMSEVEKIQGYDSTLEVTLKPDTDPSAFLKSIVDRMDVNHFSFVQPTLNNIFLEAVREHKDEGAPNE